MMNAVREFLVSNVTLTLFLCLGIGYLVGRIRIVSFKLGATIGTLITGLVLSQFADFVISGEMQSIALQLFIFTIGFDVGPAFIRSIRSSGVKVLFQALFFVAVSLVVIVLCCKLFHFSAGTAVGLAAGALTQSTIKAAAELAGSLESDATLAYALSYIFGTAGVMLFVKKIGPVCMRVNLIDAVKAKTSQMALAGNEGLVLPTGIIRTRAYVLSSAARCVGKTVGWFEDSFVQPVEICSLFRGDKRILFDDDTLLMDGDVILLIGSLSVLAQVAEYDDAGMVETAEDRYHALNIKKAEIVLADDHTQDAETLLSKHGAVLQNAVFDGKSVLRKPKKCFHKGTVITVVGVEDAINRLVNKLGYPKDAGTETDIPFVAFALVIGLLVGSLAIALGGLSLSLGASGGVLLAGLASGWLYQRNPVRGHIPASTRWFLKNAGLNLYIAIVALKVDCNLMEAMRTDGLSILLAGMIITLLPHLFTLFFSRRVLKLDAVDTLGGLCGCGTCTAALNALAEETNSSIFALSYAPGYAIGNVLLTLLGILLPILIL